MGQTDGIPAMPTADAPAAIPAAVPAAVPPAVPAVSERIRMHGRLFRSFGALGRLEVDDGIVLTRTSTGTGVDDPAAWCTYDDNPALKIVTASGGCFYDRHDAGLLDTITDR